MKAFNHSLCQCDGRKCRFALFYILHGLVYQVKVWCIGKDLRVISLLHGIQESQEQKITAGPQIT